MKIGELNALESRIEAASGQDRDLDRAIAGVLGDPSDGDKVPPYTSSVDRCIALIGRSLGGWHWHVGHGPSGILPYATLTKETGAANPSAIRVEAAATTVPLALLHAIVKAMIAERRGRAHP